MPRKITQESLGWIPPSWKRRVPIKVIAVYETPSKEEQLEIDKAILECVLGVEFKKI